jgi:hypothetical protein
MPALKMAEVLKSIQNVRPDGTEKNAAAAQAPAAQAQTAAAQKVAAAKQALVGAVEAALTPPAAKTAASAAPAASATDQLLKLANDLANAETEAELKIAQLLGAAVTDGFVARMGQHGAAAAQTKTAAETDAMVKEAMERGYADGLALAERIKNASVGNEKTAALQQGFNDTMAQIQKLASEPDGQQKLAAMKQGYADTMAKAEKIAHDCHDMGFNSTIRILQSIAK